MASPSNDEDPMALACIAAKARDTYDEQAARQYRDSDDTGASDWTHASWCDRLRTISGSFGKPLDVLDLGCGTGRYFHCLQNVRSLVGVDISPSMLAIAKDDALLKSEIMATDVQLRQGDILTSDFPPDSFDFVYSIGVFGDYAPLLPSLVERVHKWLKPGGKMFITVQDSASPKGASWKRRVATAMYPVMPRRVKVYIDVRIGDYTMDADQLRGRLGQVGFGHYDIQRQIQRRTFLFATAQKAGKATPSEGLAP